MLGQVIGLHWHALVHDVMALGFRAHDLFTTLTLTEVLSIVCGAGPHTSIRFFLDQGWSREAHLLANMAEHNAGISNLPKPYERPGVEPKPEQAQSNGITAMDVMTWAEMDAANIKRYTRADEDGVTGVRRKSRVRTL